MLRRHLAGRGRSDCKKGDLLIEGALYNQEGEKLTDVNASGTVYGTVVKNKRYVVSTEAYTYRRTGNKKTVTTLGFMGLKIGKSVSPFAFYESETTEAALSALLPIKVKRTVFYETEVVREERKPEELAEFYKQKEMEEFTAAAENIKTSAHIEALAPRTVWDKRLRGGGNGDIRLKTDI